MTINVTPPGVKSYFTTTLTKADITAGGATAWTTANSGLTLFTVTGASWLRVYGIIGATAFTSTGGLGTLAVGALGTTQLFLPTSAVNAVGAQFGANTIWVGATPLLRAAVPLLANLTWVLNNGTPIILTVATADMTAGAITVYCDWIPVSAGASVS